VASSAPVATQASPRGSPRGAAGPSTNGVIAVLALAGMVAALQQTLVLPLIPDLPEILNVAPTTASWAVTVTLLTGAMATPIVSRLADMVGKRRMIVVALITMTAGSVLVAAGGGFVTTVVGRGLQGFASSLIPVGISIMRDSLPRERVGFAVALMSATLGIGMALGLPLSGVLYGHFGFDSIFWVAALGGALLTVAVLRWVPESGVRTPGRTFDYLGAVLFSLALASALLVISKGGDWGWGGRSVVGLLCVSFLTLLVWFPYELRVNDPMVDLRTAARRPVLLTNIASIGVAFALFVNLLASGQQLQMSTATGYGFGLTVTQAGLAMMPAGLAMVILSPVAGRMLDRLGGRVTLLVGAGIMSVSYVFRVFATGSVAEVVLGSSLVGLGAAVSFAAMPTLIMAHVPITESASANGLNSLMRAVGGSISSAVLAAVLSSVSATAAGEAFPSLSAFQDVYWISAAASLLAVVLVAFIPTRRQGAPSTALSGAGGETVVHGQILPGDGRVQKHAAIVTVTQLDGEPVDWARTDNDGRYSVALPGSGRYLVVANTRGWAPRADVLDFREGDTELHVELTEELALTGVALRLGVPMCRSLVLLHEGTGEFVSKQQTDEHGQFRFALPPAGAYILTAVDELGQQAHSRKAVVTALGAHIVIEVGP
jgi:MFS family permease